MTDGDEREGIERVGERSVVIRRASLREWDHSQAIRSGRETALQEVLQYVLDAHAHAPQYSDTRPWAELAVFLRDKIKENADGAQT